jgi:hypothetical protein
LIRFTDGGAHIELTLTLGGLAGEKMTLVRAPAFKFALTRFLKTLGSTFVGFDLDAHG